ncbi:hypothetical protein Y1Q_0011779 [Alligator mississippiensis]|uniref:Uncharacterized protein n=1 Tax=Alligator mississippiensis TaxID=8496 RepID=A0A151M158_ALLMI|nr:hypothetical protein Y1Q_0011779 [Alligator mississippiensis]
MRLAAVPIRGFPLVHYKDRGHSHQTDPVVIVAPWRDSNFLVLSVGLTNAHKARTDNKHLPKKTKRLPGALAKAFGPAVFCITCYAHIARRGKKIHRRRISCQQRWCEGANRDQAPIENVQFHVSDVDQKTVQTSVEKKIFCRKLVNK